MKIIKELFLFIKEKRHFIQYVTLKIIYLALGLLPNMLIVRKISSIEYGKFSVFQLVVNLIISFGFSWSSSSILYFGAKEKLESGSMNKTFWSRNIIMGGSLLIFTIGIMLFNTQINEYIGIPHISIYVFVWLIIAIIENYLNQYFLAAGSQIFSMAMVIVPKIVYLILIYTVTFHVKSLIIIYIFTHSLTFLFIFKIQKRDIGRFVFDKDWIVKILKFSGWELFGYAGLYLINFGDIAVIKHYMGEADIAVYNIAYSLFTAVAGLCYLISNYFASQITVIFENKDSKELAKFYIHDRAIIMAVAAVVHFIIFVISNPIITFLYGTQYSKAGNIFKALLFSSVLQFGIVFYVLYTNCSLRNKSIHLLNILQAVINIIVDFILVPRIGLMGAAIGTLTAACITFLFQVILYEPQIQKKIKDIW